MKANETVIKQEIKTEENASEQEMHDEEKVYNILPKPKRGKWIVKLTKLQKCDNCDLYFTKSSAFLKHNQNAHVRYIKESKKYNCKQCERSFLSNWKLLEHYKVSHQEMKYNCKNCEKRYMSRQKLSQHVKTA